MTAPDTLPPELAELGELLREDPPRPDPGWARELDARAAAGFPRPPRRLPWAVLKAHRRVLAPAVGFACVVLLVAGVATVNLAGDGPAGGDGATTSAEGGGAASDAGAAGGGTGPEAADRSLAPPPAAPGPGGGSPRSDGRRTRAQERSAALTLAARPGEVESVAAGILRVTDGVGGFVAASTVNDGSGAGGSFELRIPSGRLEKAMADLSRLAAVRERSQSSRDITAETVSARERLRAAEREREGLLRALARASSLNETNAVRARLRTVDRELAAARRAVRQVENRAAYANVSVALVAEDEGGLGPAGDGRWTPGDALRDSLRVLEVAAGVAVIALAIALPFALLGALAAGGARATGRWRRERALDSA